MIDVNALSARVGTFALRDVTFAVPRGEYGVVIGPAGAGKTTLLETICGLVAPTTGSITLDGVDVTRHAPEQRRVGIVYQHAYLFPHMTVAENIAYAAADPSLATALAEHFDVATLADRDVTTLSGGERQLVALARALAPAPDVLLLDEPFAALDNRTRVRARRALRAHHAERRFTALHVTHDFAEAGLLGDVLMLLDRGRLIQTGTPEAVFSRPANSFVADFVGAENIFAGHVNQEMAKGPFDDASGAATFIVGPLSFAVAGDIVNGATHAIIRAEEIAISRTEGGSSVRNQFRGTISEMVPSGAIRRMTVDIQGIPVVAATTTRSADEMRLHVGDEVVVAFKATAVHLC